MAQKTKLNKSERKWTIIRTPDNNLRVEKMGSKSQYWYLSHGSHTIAFFKSEAIANAHMQKMIRERWTRKHSNAEVYEY